MPALERGFAKARAAGQEKSFENFEVSYPCFVVTGRDEAEMDATKVATTRQIAFYGSTPAYKPVLDSIGAGDLQPELNAMSKQGRWAEMGTLIDDAMMGQFAVVGEPGRIAGEIKSRFGDIVDRTSAAYGGLPQEDRAQIIAELTA